MPVSPTDSVSIRDAVAYQEAGERLDELAQAGFSWSGNERNCAYLNVGVQSKDSSTATKFPPHRPFANISSVSGFDLPDDGRSMAVVDWDHDGDLDIWLANRTAPRVRFLQNQMPNFKHFVSVRLTGTRCNRDAVGARVVVTAKRADALPSTQPFSRQMRTLRAGEGFLGQSSKWLHFGLGSSAATDPEFEVQITVNWPDGTRQSFGEVRPGHHYLVVQDKQKLEPWHRMQEATSMAATNSPTVSINNRDVDSTDERNQRDAAAASVRNAPTSVASRLPTAIQLPPLDYSGYDGKTHSIGKRSHRKTLLVCLWASWCQPCLSELVELSQLQDEFPHWPMEFLALSASQGARPNETARNPVPNPDPQGDQAILQKLGIKSDSGVATEELVNRIQLLHDHFFKPHLPLALPTSLLVHDGRLAVIYQGQISIQQLRDDVQRLQGSEAEWIRTSLPFEGRWQSPPRAFRPLPLAAKLIEAGYLVDALAYISDSRSALSADAGFAALLNRLGREQLKQGQEAAALEQFRGAIEVAPHDADGYYNAGIVYSRRHAVKDAVEMYEMALQRNSNHLQAINNLGNIYQGAKEWSKAEALYLRAISLNRAAPDVRFNLGNVYLEQQNWDAAQIQLAETVRLDPTHARAHNNLGNIASRAGDVEAARLHFERAIRENPNYARAHHNLGNIFLAQRKNGAAIQSFRKAVELEPNLLDAHSKLGRALVATKQNTAAIQPLGIVVEASPNDVGTAALLAWLLATEPNVQWRDAARAVKLAKRAVQATGTKDAGALDILAAAYAAEGDFARAVATAELAISRFESQGKTQSADQVRNRLAKYRREKPHLSGDSNEPN